MTIEKRLIPKRKLDNVSFEKLFREYFSPLMAFARRILADEGVIVYFTAAEVIRDTVVIE